MNFGRKRYFLVRNLMGVILILIWLTSGGFSNAAYAISGQAGKQLAQTENKNFNKANQITPKEILGGQDEAGQIGMEINTLATSMFSDVYGGMELTNNGKDIIVYLTNLDSKVENYIKNQYPLSNIIFKKTNNNMDQMKN